MFTIEDTTSKIDIVGLSKLVDTSKVPNLSREELEAIHGHRLTDQSHLVKENFVIHRNSLIVTTLLENGMEISDFISEILKCCRFPCKIYLGSENL